GWGGYAMSLLDDGRLALTKNGVDNVTSTPSVTDTNWHHVAVTKNGSNIVFYIDGAGQTGPAYDPGFTFEQNVIIGASNDALLAGFLGLIDEVSIYNRALSADEIAGIYRAGSAGKCAPSVPQATTLAHWKFDEASGSVAHDSAGSFNGNLSPSGALFVPE